MFSPCNRIVIRELQQEVPRIVGLGETQPCQKAIDSDLIKVEMQLNYCPSLTGAILTTHKKPIREFIHDFTLRMWFSVQTLTLSTTVWPEFQRQALGCQIGRLIVESWGAPIYLQGRK